MATIPKTISVTERNEQWISCRIQSGEYGSVSEYIRDLIRRDEERRGHIDAIRSALIAGETSGISDRSPSEIREAAIERLKSNGKILPKP